jgi:hypothetical protein
MDPDAEILTKVSKIEKFFESVLYKDSLHDWQAAKDLGELLIRIDGDEIMGHALLARACRHLGDSERARAELQRCRAIAPHPPEQELFRNFLTEEERLLENSSCKDQSDET